ncbi:hypothetical protein PWT90_01517 [Aphanocladium album]|nr:hypothetical protein PWT90_01517 [Aphanocladium album]
MLVLGRRNSVHRLCTAPMAGEAHVGLYTVTNKGLRRCSVNRVVHDDTSFASFLRSKSPGMIMLKKESLALESAIAAPSRPEQHRPRADAHPLCRGVLLYSEAQCCDVIALNVAALGCVAMKGNASTPPEFQAYCAKNGKTAACCTIPVAGIDLLCSES